jgi:hypothetical protein
MFQNCANVIATVGAPKFFLCPQPQYRNVKDALRQSQFCKFLQKCGSASAIPQSQFFQLSSS